ncbi:hypothetical protein [Rhodospirillum sp. A1_3_36]|uniref:hypothetical protein n=1 Tax=Rhodospirillum sp. A1_3_36 TaxID=3391666 RepID=UPI0039A68480
MARLLKSIGVTPNAMTPPHLRGVRQGDDRWKDLTRRGNAAFEAEKLDQAEILYQEALAEAEAFFGDFIRGQGPAGVDAAPMLIVSTGNLAELAIRSGALEQAGILVLALCWRLEGVLGDQTLARPIREACFTHSRYALVQAMEKLPRVGWAADAVQREVERFQAVALGYLGEAGAGECLH